MDSLTFGLESQAELLLLLLCCQSCISALQYSTLCASALCTTGLTLIGGIISSYVIIKQLFHLGRINCDYYMLLIWNAGRRGNLHQFSALAFTNTRVELQRLPDAWTYIPGSEKGARSGVEWPWLGSRAEQSASVEVIEEACEKCPCVPSQEPSCSHTAEKAHTYSNLKCQGLLTMNTKCTWFYHLVRSSYEG